MSDGDVSCTARDASLQILFRRPTPVIMSETAAQPTRLAHSCEAVEAIAPATQKKHELQKVVLDIQFLTLLTWERFAPQPRLLFSAAQLSKSGPNPWCLFRILTLTCASCHSRTRFNFQHLNFQERSEHEAPLDFSLRNVLRASTSKSAPLWFCFMLTWARHSGLGSVQALLT
eukprot:s858_g10.t1